MNWPIDTHEVFLALASSSTFEEARTAVLETMVKQLEALHFQQSLMGDAALPVDELEKDIEVLSTALKKHQESA